jgi:choline dehydrogenase-like flavoprotein
MELYVDFDYVIVGGGSAGCVLAGRLSQDPKVSVCLLEAGKADKSLLVHTPVGAAAIIPSKSLNWAYETVPQAGLNGRRGYQPRGKVLGGSSSINAMVYIRGHRWDYDHWRSLGNPGWSYDEVLPYFKKAENNERGADEYHAVGGPLNVAELRSPRGIGKVFLEAAQQMQLPLIDDFNGADQEGVGAYQVTQKNGRRCSAAGAYLAPALARPNLEVLTEAPATGLLLDGRKAVGVAYRRDGAGREVRARREVILSGGAFASPQLLLLSGIGPARELRHLGIDVVHDLPGVGKNLQDHIDFVSAFKTGHEEALGVTWGAAASLPGAIAQYRREGRGWLTSNFAETGGFAKSDASLALPDLQFHFVVAIVDNHARNRHFARGYSCHVCLLRPKSVGRMSLVSADPAAAPLIDPNFLAERQDLDAMIKGVRLMQQILEAPAFAPHRGEELYPVNIADNAALAQAIRERADTVYHPVGTCKMGADHMAVVDAELRLHGVENLRVADASIMPTLIGGNTNAPTIMIGEKAADMIQRAA